MPGPVTPTPAIGRVAASRSEGPTTRWRRRGASPSDGEPHGELQLHRDARRFATDLAIAAATVAFDVTLWSDVFASSPGGELKSSPPAIVLAFATLGLALAWRRRFPVPVFAFLCLHSIAGALLLTYRPIFPVCVALATIAARSRRETLVAAFACGVLTSGTWVANEIRTSAQVTASSVVVLVGLAYLVVLLIAVGVGRWQHANKQRVRLLERQRREEAQRAVAAERLRVARELHDIVAHTVTVMVLQAAGARRVMHVDQRRAEAALGAVEDAGTQAMEELRRLLGVLRAGDDVSAEDPTEAALQPGLADVNALVETVRGTGMDVVVEVSGHPGRVDPSVDLAAYRVVQEGLTNVSKHAGSTAKVVVRIEWSDAALSLSVEDEGGAAKPVRRDLSTGHGLLGLAERVELVGGSVRAEPGSVGGFRLSATLPTARGVSGPPIRGDRPGDDAPGAVKGEKSQR